MCTIADESMVRRKSFSDLNGLSDQEALAISQIAGMLFRFRDISQELSEVVDMVTAQLKKHIRRYSRKQNSLSVDEPESAIDGICDFASKLIEVGDINYNALVNALGVPSHPSRNRTKFNRIDKIIAGDAPFQFNKKWLSNVKLLIPNKECVIGTLPFLLTCYSINALWKRNKVDPYEYIAKSEITNIHNHSCFSGWCEVFPEYNLNCQDDDSLENRNLKRHIDHLAKYLTVLPSSVHESDTQEPDTQESDNLYKPHILSLLHSDCYSFFGKPIEILSFPGSVLGEAEVKQASGKDKKPEPELELEQAKANEKEKNLLKMVTDWELYRWFASFCDACNEYELSQKDRTFNLTLSMALFAKMWDLDDEYMEDLMPKDDEFIRPLTMEDVNSDAIRSDIIKIVQMQDSNCIDIHSIARARKIWLLRYVYDIEPLIYF